MGSAAAQATDTVAKSASDAGSAAASAAGRVAGALKDAASSSLDAAGEYAEMATDTMRSTSERAQQAGQDLVRNMAKLTREQPLIVAAAGLAIGAAIAALLPKTEMEDSLMGETSDAVKRSVGDVATDGVGAAADAVERVSDQVGRAAEDAGLSPSRAAEGVQALGDKVAGVAIAGIEAAQQEADKLLNRRNT